MREPARVRPHPSPVPSLPFEAGGTYVICPHVPGMLRPETRLSLGQLPGRVWFVATPANDAFAYGRLFMWLWAVRATWVMVEQDIIAPAGSLERLAECPRPWCAHGYAIGQQTCTDGLGLCKFSAELAAQHPDLIRLALCRKRAGRVDVDWTGVHPALGRALREAVGPPHRHAPDAVHLHPYGEAD